MVKGCVLVPGKSVCTRPALSHGANRRYLSKKNDPVPPLDASPSSPRSPWHARFGIEYTLWKNSLPLARCVVNGTVASSTRGAYGHCGPSTNQVVAVSADFVTSLEVSQHRTVYDKLCRLLECVRVTKRRVFRIWARRRR